MNKTEPVHPQKLLENALKKDLNSVIIISMANDEKINVEWSSIPIPTLVFMHKIAGMAIDAKIRAVSGGI